MGVCVCVCVCVCLMYSLVFRVSSTVLCSNSVQVHSYESKKLFLMGQ